jgi:hypothetical protein
VANKDGLFEDETLPGSSAPPPEPDKICTTLPAQHMSDALEVWEFFCRFGALLDLERTPTLADLEAVLAQPRSAMTAELQRMHDDLHAKVVQLLVGEVYGALVDYWCSISTSNKKRELANSGPAIEARTWQEGARRWAARLALLLCCCLLGVPDPAGEAASLVMNGRCKGCTPVTVCPGDAIMSWHLQAGASVRQHIISHPDPQIQHHPPCPASVNQWALRSPPLPSPPPAGTWQQQPPPCTWAWASPRALQ